MKVKFNNAYFSSFPVNDYICRIYGAGQEIMTLVEGNKKALLFDTGLGYGNIKEFVEQITDKDIIVVNSHGHGDHVGGNACFKEAYIHPADLEMAKKVTLEDRCNSLPCLERQRGYEIINDMSPMVPKGNIEYKTCMGGDIFDLGGIKLEVIEMPGHTKGSIALFDEEHRYILTGDAICRGTLLCMPNAPTMEEFRDMLKNFIDKYKDKIDFVLEAHGPCPDQFRIFEGNLDAVEGVLSGKYPGYKDAFGTIMNMPMYRAKEEVGLEGFCKDGMLGNITWIKV